MKKKSNHPPKRLRANRLAAFSLLFLILFTFSGCQAIQDIFAAGFWLGAIAILILVIVIVMIFRALRS